MVRRPFATAALRALTVLASSTLVAGPLPGPDLGAAPAVAVVVPGGLDHACVVGTGTPAVAWSRLSNPLLRQPAAGVKDQALVWAGGRWHMLFSDVTTDAALPGGVRWDIATSTSTDLAHWTAPVLWPPQSGVIGVVSPDIVRRPGGTFVVTYDSGPGQVGGGEPKLYYRTSVNLRT
ncbi:MAG: hypothetical protein ACRDY1_03250, partial [Acidimicrobiales bacterium]